MPDELEELNAAHELPPEAAAAPAAGPEVAPPLPTPTPKGKAFPQLYRFFWGGLIVLVGSLLPFGPHVVTNMLGDKDPEATQRFGKSATEERNRELARTLGTDAPPPGEVAKPEADAATELLPEMQACRTFSGALFLLIGLIVIGQMYGAIRERRIVLGGILLMFIPCAWSWSKLIKVSGDLAWFGDLNFWGYFQLRTYDLLARDLGSGFLLILLGSTYVVINFVLAIFGVATSGKKKDEGAAAGRGRVSRRR